MSDTDETFHLPLEAAEAYEANFVPHIFTEWAPHTLDAAGVRPGTRLLDVACGTGIVARTAVERVGPHGHVVGLDLNPAMLTVARRTAPQIAWREGDATALPIEDATFDAVTCQMALMFFPDRLRALAEMRRVVGPGGRVGLVVPASIEAQPAYRPFVDIAVEHAGEAARSLLATYWSCGDLDALLDLVAGAGLDLAEHRTRTGTARFADSDAFVATEVEGSPLAERIDAATYERIARDVGVALARYGTADGRLEVPLVCHVVAAVVPG